MRQAEALKELTTKVKISNPHNITEAFVQCIRNKPEAITATLTESLFKMLITRKISLCLLELASPEEIFQKRNFLPMDLINEYFQQEYFSLKTLLQCVPDCGESRHSKVLKYVVHTRSNGQVVGIPTFRSDMEKLHNLELVQTYVHSDPECIMIEHLNSLKNESTLRSIIDAWCDNDLVKYLLIIVDMSSHVSTERVNFLRCCIDQVNPKKEKKFLSILH